MPEGARLARAAVVVRRLAHEIEALRGARAGRVEEVAIERDRIRPREPCTSLVQPPPSVVVEERRPGAPAGEAPLLQPEHEDGVEAPRASAPQVDDRHPARVVARPGRQRCTLDRRENVLAADLPGELAPALELVEQPPQRLVGSKVEPARGVRRRPFDPVRAPEHSFGELPHRRDRIRGVAQLRQLRQRLAAQAFRLVDDPLRRLHGAPPQASLDEIDRPPLEPGKR